MEKYDPDEDKRFCVYFHLDKNTREVRYIGSGSLRSLTPRPTSKVNRSNKHLQEWDNLFAIIHRDNMTKVEARELEKKIYDEFHEGVNLLNEVKVAVEKELKYSELSEYFYYDELSPSGIRLNKTIISDEGLMLKTKGRSVGSPSKRDGYYRVCMNYKQYMAHRVVYCLVSKQDLHPGLLIHHKNGIRHDNRFENLEPCSPLYNSRNSAVRKNSKSGVTGVFWNIHRNRPTGCWTATWVVGCKQNRRHFVPTKLFPTLPFDEALLKAFEMAVAFRKEMEELHYK